MAAHRDQDEEIINQMKEMTTNVVHIMNDATEKVNQYVNDRVKKMKSLRDRITSTVEKNVLMGDASTENISYPITSSKVEKNYNDFIDADQMDAVELLSKMNKDKGIGCKGERITCFIFEVVYETAKDAWEKYREKMKRYLDDPIGTTLKSSNPTSSSNSVVPATDTSIYAMDHMLPIDEHLKKTAHSIDVSAIVEKVKKNLSKEEEKFKKDHYFKLPLSDILKEKQLHDVYITRCAELAWQMIVQKPTLSIEYQKKHFDPKYHEESNPVQQESSGTSNELKIMYLWPALLKGDEVISKGKVHIMTDDEVTIGCLATGESTNDHDGVAIGIEATESFNA